MSNENHRSKLYIAAVVSVALICLGAMALSTKAVIENLHFVQATNDMSSVVTAVRGFAKEQRAFSIIPGDNLLAYMIQMDQIPASKALANPWKGGFRAIGAPNGLLRIESDLPAHICRRMALYLLGRKPADLGLLSMEASAGQAVIWKTIYPSPGMEAGAAAQYACGKTGEAHLALSFKIKD